MGFVSASTTFQRGEDGDLEALYWHLPRSRSICRNRILQMKRPAIRETIGRFRSGDIGVDTMLFQ
jgi:hypothetical protein